MRKNIFIRFWDWLLNRKSPAYTIPSALITYTKEGLEKGIRDDQNKQIIYHSYNRYGNLKEVTYPYSEARVFALEKIRKIPVFDKTQKEEKFPIWNRVLPQEVSFTTK